MQDESCSPLEPLVYSLSGFSVSFTHFVISTGTVESHVLISIGARVRLHSPIL